MQVFGEYENFWREQICEIFGRKLCMTGPKGPTWCLNTVQGITSKRKPRLSYIRPSQRRLISRQQGLFSAAEKDFFFNAYLFIFSFLKDTTTERQRKTCSICWFTPQVSSVVGVWPTLNLGAQNLNQVSCVDGRGSSNRALSCAAAQDVHQQEAGSETQSGLKLDTTIWEVGILSSGLTCCCHNTAAERDF